MRRRLPRPAELAPLLRFKRPVLSPIRRRLQKALTIDDLRRIARRTMPRAAFDYADGAAEQELSLARAREAFRDVEFRPAILRDVSRVDLRDLLGRRAELPFGIAPTGFTRLMHTEGEVAGASAAGDAGIPTRSPRWARPRARMSPRPTPMGATGSSSTCGRTATGPWAWLSERRRRATRRWS